MIGLANWMRFFKSKQMFGIDVSHHNGVIDWGKVSQNSPKIDFALIKASTGVGSEDPKFHFNSYEANKYGVKAGYYHFSSLNDYNVEKDAKAEAEWFISVIKKSPIPGLPLALDIELEDPKIQLSDGQVVRWIESFFSTLKANGYDNYVLYSYTPFLDTHLPTNHSFGNIRLWLAAYTASPMPKLPKGWSDYWMWQYSAKGRVSGILTDVDLNKTKQPV